MDGNTLTNPFLYISWPGVLPSFLFALLLSMLLPAESLQCNFHYLGCTNIAAFFPEQCFAPIQGEQYKCDVLLILWSYLLRRKPLCFLCIFSVRRPEAGALLFQAAWFCLVCREMVSLGRCHGGQSSIAVWQLTPFIRR